MTKIKETIIITEDYQIDVIEVPLKKIFVDKKTRKKFKSLSSRGKLTRLEFLKRMNSVREELKLIIEKSKYLRLLEDGNGFHIRYEEGISEKELRDELVIVDYIKDNYSIFVDIEVNSGISGDINRVRIK